MAHIPDHEIVGVTDTIDSTYHNLPSNLSKGQLVRLGHQLRGLLIRAREELGTPVNQPLTEDEIIRLRDALGHIGKRTFGIGAPESFTAFKALAGLADLVDGMLWIIGLTKWADSGFPQVEMSHKFCAALLVSEATKDVVDSVRHPWPAFFIEVPEGMLAMTGTELDDGREIPIRRILVLQLANPHGEWAYIASGPSRSGVSLWHFGTPASDLLPPTEDDVEEAIGRDEHAFVAQQELTTLDKRATMLIGRLVISTVAALTMDGMTEKVGKGHQVYAKRGASGLGAEELVLVYKVGKPITIDFRERVRNFIAGTGHKLEARSLVRGHFKRQHFGPLNASVKVQWRKPFWRGPETAPIVVRPHVLDGE